MTKFARNKALLVKMDTAYGEDAMPTGAANAIQALNFKFEPSVGQDIGRDLILPTMGHQGVILTGNFARISYDVEVVGSGEPGTPPPYGACLRSCGMAEVVTEDEDATYNPISNGFESSSHYFINDGIKHIMLGCRGTWKLNFQPDQVARWSFTMTGLLGTISDVAMPTVDLTKFIKPVPVSKANTTYELFGYAGACETFSFDLGADIQARLLINAESIEYVDRQMTGQATMAAASLATIDWFGKAAAHETGTMEATHGKTAGNIVSFSGGKFQLGRPSYAENQKILSNQLSLMVLPDVGNDEFFVTFK